MAHVIHVTVLFLLGTLATYLVGGGPTNDTLFLIAEVEGGNLTLIEWDLKAAKSDVSVLSPVPGSYSTTSTFAAFDPPESKLYWSTGPGKLFTRYIGDSPMQNNMSLLESTDSLPFAVDDVTRLIYYAKSTDSGSIYAMTMDGKYSAALVRVPGQSIREVEADPGSGFLYWLSEVKTAGVRYIIYRCDVAGGNTKEIFAPAAGAVESFTLDRAGNALYCVHGSTFLKLSYSGSVISNMTFNGLIKITYAADGILYGITSSRSVIKVDFNASTSEYLTPPVGALLFRLSDKGMAFYSPKTPRGSNKCSSSVHPCSHFCLPAPGQTFKCACPVDHVLLKDNKTCEKTISCDPIALDHSKINCYRSPDDKQYCKFQCDSGYVYHPRYNLTELFECKARVWHPEPDMQKCLEIEKPTGVRIHGNMAFNASYPCHLLKPAANEKAVKTKTITLLTGSGRPLESTCLTYSCHAWTLPSCDEGKNLLKVKFYFDIETTLDAAARQTLKNNITASFAAAMLQPSKYKIDVSGDIYPMAYLTFVKLGHACHAMYEESDTGCVACPAGTQFNETLELCELCPKASYSNRPKSFQCTQCGPHQTTLREGAASSSECKDFCKEGHFYDNRTKSCKECEVGYFQDTVGTAPCKHCGDGKTTHGRGSKLPSDCLDLCPAGHYHNNKTKSCQPCEKDTFQNKTWSYSCPRCPHGMVTANKGAKSTADCILSCQVGKFFEVKKGYCERCPANHYQDSEGSTSCVPCGSGLISNVGSDSKSDCERQDQTLLIAGSVGGVVLFIVVLAVSVVLCKKRCKRLLPERPETGFENPPPVINDISASQNGFNSNGGVPHSQFGGDFDPYERTLSSSQPDPYTLLGPVQMRSRYERYEEGQGPFNREPGPPSVPGGRYMSPEEWTQSRLQQLEEEARNSGVYDDLKEDDPYDMLPDCAKGPTGPEDVYLEPVNAAGVHGGAHVKEDDDGYIRLKDGAKGPTGPDDASTWRVAGAHGGTDLEPTPPVMAGDIQLDTLDSRY